MRVRPFLISLLLLAGSCVCTGAYADDSGQVRVTARRAVIEGDLPRARAILNDAFSGDVAAAERAATAELLFVVDAWSSGGRPRAVTATNDAPMPDAEGDWERAFANARSLLIQGHYSEAARRLDVLVGRAPELVAGARAAELRALARDLAPSAAPEAAPVVVAPPASSPPRAEEGPQEIKTETHWYGWQILIVDGASIIATPLAPPLGVAGYLLGGPIVHAAHLHGVSLLASLGVRVLLPAAGIIIGAQAAKGCSGWFCELEGAAIGALIAIPIAITIDVGVIAREDVPVEKKNATIVPMISTKGVGVGGTF